MAHYIKTLYIFMKAIATRDAPHGQAINDVITINLIQ